MVLADKFIAFVISDDIKSWDRLSAFFSLKFFIIFDIFSLGWFIIWKLFLIKFQFIKELVYGNGQKKQEKSNRDDDNDIKLRRSSRLKHRTNHYE